MFALKVPSEQLDNPEKLVYSWVEQVFSINSSHPRYIQYPLNVLLGGSMTPDEEYSSCMAVELPRSLPLHCKKAHMHKWRKQSVSDILVK